MSGAPHDGREDGPGGVIASKASFAHARAIVDDERSDFFFHCDRWKRRSRGAEKRTAEQRDDYKRTLAAASETDRGLPRRYLSEAGRARGAVARAAPEHVHIWRSFRTPGAHWPARPGHVGPRARPRPPPAPPPTAPPAPALLPRPRARDPAPNSTRAGWPSALRGCERIAERTAGPTGRPRPGTAARRGGRARLHPETAWPGAGPRPESGCVAATRPRWGAVHPSRPLRASSPGSAERLAAKAIPGSGAGLGEGRVKVSADRHVSLWSWGTPGSRDLAPWSHTAATTALAPPPEKGAPCLESLAVQTGPVLLIHGTSCSSNRSPDCSGAGFTPDVGQPTPILWGGNGALFPSNHLWAL